MNQNGNRKPEAGNSPAFTLVELLTVISIIGILAGLLSAVLPAAIKRAKMMKARTEIADIANAIQAYDTDNSRFPASTNAQAAASAAGGDFTYGGVFQSPGGPLTIAHAGYPANNAEVVAILMDLTAAPDGSPTVNANHVKNPRQVKYLNARMSGYNPATNDPNPPGGVDNKGIYRDPWGNPYIISMDLNYDEFCRDVFYGLDQVSGVNQTAANPGINGLSTDGNANNFRLRGKVMVWSAGPDKSVDPASAANQGLNKDNVTSWQEK